MGLKRGEKTRDQIVWDDPMVLEVAYLMPFLVSAYG
jgi:hypothetical protein